MDIRPDQVIYYTDKMLTENFISVDQALRLINGRITHLEGHVEEIARVTAALAKGASKVRGKKLPFVAGAVAGIYLYRKFQGSSWKIEVGDGVKIDTAEKKPADYTVKDNGKPENTEKDTDKQPPSA